MVNDSVSYNSGGSLPPKWQTKGTMDNNIITAEAQALSEYQLMDELTTLVQTNMEKDVLPWLKEYLAAKERYLQCPAIQMGAQRQEAQSKYNRMLVLTTAYIKSMWLTTFAERISQSEYERIIDYHIYKMLKEAGANV